MIIGSLHYAHVLKTIYFSFFSFEFTHFCVSNMNLTSMLSCWEALKLLGTTLLIESEKGRERESSYKSLWYTLKNNTPLLRLISSLQPNYVLSFSSYIEARLTL
jgi:hypothetical protein